ncbi:hypothetical protein [Saccharothrix sp. ALI-22-I]|uniref:hypothetical protein n=1 Tax=Saccharothrix sp. ALI-22-I TaxID=1933778 RepID=UPI0015C3DE12|nr:hypothetical protein [Saccharothrix sp. ALI-22-I]
MQGVDEVVGDAFHRDRKPFLVPGYRVDPAVELLGTEVMPLEHKELGPKNPEG